MKKCLCLLLALLVLSMGVWAADDNVSEEAQPAYTDVASSHWACEAIDAMVEAHVTTGFPDGTFRPDDTVSRAQFLAMVLRAVYPDDIALAEDGQAWWQPYLDAARSTTLTSSLEWNTDQAPMDLPITRFEAATLLDRTNGTYNGLTLTAGWEPADGFTDQGDFPTLYEAHVRSAAGGGLISGYPDGSFRGEKTLTRAEACVLIQRLLDREDLLSEGEYQAVYTGEILIKYLLRSDGGAQITSVDLTTGKAVQTLNVDSDGFRSFDEMRQQAPALWQTTFGRTVSGSDDSAFWGEIGYYTYDANGNFTQWTDRAVLDQVPAPDGDGILAISHDKGQRLSYSAGGAYIPVGDQVLRIRQDGTVETFLSNSPAHGLNLASISAADGQVRVVHEFTMGMSDQYRYEYAVENGKLRALEHTPGDGFSGYTAEEAAAEQARLDAAGCGIGGS